MRGIISWSRCELCGRIAETYSCTAKGSNVRVCALCSIALASLSPSIRCSTPFTVKKPVEKPRLEPDAEILKRISSIGSEKARKERREWRKAPAS
ncbi:MAG: hypothetical protein QXS85_06180 [Acidilobaceae archaeon]